MLGAHGVQKLWIAVVEIRKHEGYGVLRGIHIALQEIERTILQDRILGAAAHAAADKNGHFIEKIFIRHATGDQLFLKIDAQDVIAINDFSGRGGNADVEIDRAPRVDLSRECGEPSILIAECIVGGR